MKAKIAWAFAGEAVLVGLIYGLLLTLVSPESLAAFIKSALVPLLTLLGLLFGGQLAVVIYYLQQGTSELGLYLRYKGIDSAFTAAFVVPVLVSLLAFIGVCVAGGVNSFLIANGALILAMYAVLNLATTLFNAVEYRALGQEVKRQLRAEEMGRGDSDSAA